MSIGCIISETLSCALQILGIVYSAKLQAVPEAQLYTRENYYTGKTSCRSPRAGSPLFHQVLPSFSAV